MTPAAASTPRPVVALAGRRVDAADAKEPRFSPKDVDVVRERVRRMLRDVQPAALVCSAACGADLLALDEAADLGIPRRIVLPFAKDRFRETSVVDRPGNWGPTFDRLVAQAEADGALVVADVGEGDEGYREANRAILREAARGAAGGVEAWIVWNGRPRDEGDITLHFSDEAFRRACFVRVVSTRSADAPPPAPPDTATCFVVMPFGTKPVDGAPVPFDAIFDTMLAPAIAGVALPEGGTLTPYRTDRDLAPDLIDQAMFRRLEYSRFVLCDLTGLNPNVMFELGMRFHARSAGTVLFRQPGTPLPFDITSVKVFEYDVREPATARRTIAQVLTTALERNRLDSPIRRTLDRRADAADAASVAALLREAEAALASGDAATARAKYADAARLSPRDAVIRLRLATLEKRKQHPDWRTVLAEATAATELAPDYAEAWRERGVAEGQIRRAAAEKAGLADGVESLRTAIRLNPNDFDAYASLGGILRRQEKLPEALAAYRASVDVSEGHPYPLLNVVKLEAEVLHRIDLSRYRHALEVAASIRASQADARPPADAPWCFFDLAEIRLYQGRPDDAVATLRAGGSHYGPGPLKDFRYLLARLLGTGVAIPGLDRLMACADELLATA